MNTRPVLIIDDDQDDLDLISEAFSELNISNKIVCFSKAEDAIDFLSGSNVQPLFILCDVNMYGMNGFELRQKIYDNEKLRVKSIPFLFLSTGGTAKSVAKAYDLSVQGYFIKPTSIKGIVTMLRKIIHYWTTCYHPNTRGLEDEGG